MLSIRLQQMYRKCGLLDAIVVNKIDSGFYLLAIDSYRFTDIGGGAVKNDTRNSLARIPLRWMIRECFKVGTGIMFHEEMLKQVGLDPGSLWPHIRERPPHATASLDDQDRHTSIAGPSSNTLSNSEGQHSANLADLITEEYEDEMDALSPMNDVLKTDPGWWVLEMLPYKVKYQRKQSNDSDEDDSHYSSMGRRESGSGSSSGKWASKISYVGLVSIISLFHSPTSM